MTKLWRLLLLVLCVVLLASVTGMHLQTRAQVDGHETYYTFGSPWLLEARDLSLYGVLAWCIVFVRRDPLMVRAGLAAVTIALLLLTLPVLEARITKTITRAYNTTSEPNQH